VILYLTIGPLFAIPRTATVSFEIGVAPIVGHGPIALLCFTACFFAAAYYLAIRPNGILDSVGKILTPVFAFLILSLVVVGAIAYGNLESAKASADYAGKAFGSGVLAGYNTLDALAAVAFCLVATETLKK
ncbi:branched-chain amino acid transport system II carrier protein, partial [Streptococcus agalactiae]|nr:branched-chain amino acid transport system II carrier protein [Streptococcus agalactiae]